MSDRDRKNRGGKTTIIGWRCAENLSVNSSRTGKGADMKKWLINYATDHYGKTQKFNSWTGKHIAKFDEVIEYSPADLDVDFRRQHKEILAIPRLAGLALWKPYIMLKALADIRDGDFLFYCDAGTFFVKSIDYIINTMGDGDIWVSDIGLIEKQWSKKETLILMNAWQENILESNQIQSGFIGIRKCARSIDFIQEWLEMCTDIRLIYGKTQMTEEDYYIAHREDQSILSILCKLRRIKPHKDPTQYGKTPFMYACSERIFKEPQHHDAYKSIIYLHRKRKLSMGTLVRLICYVVLPPRIIYLMGRKRLTQEKAYDPTARKF